jgi:hypothetical protein
MKEDNLNETIIEEKKHNIKTNKNNEMELCLRNINNEEFSITLFTINQKPYRKYKLKCNLKEFQKNRFFKIFINIEEIMREINNKIKKSTFFEETNLIIMDIPIGLTVINEILLEIRETEKNKNEMEIIINELLKNKEEMEKKINELRDENNKLKEKNKEKIEKQINELRDENNKLKENIEQIKKIEILYNDGTSNFNQFIKMKEEIIKDESKLNLNQLVNITDEIIKDETKLEGKNISKIFYYKYIILIIIDKYYNLLRR